MHYVYRVYERMKEDEEKERLGEGWPEGGDTTDKGNRGSRTNFPKGR